MSRRSLTIGFMCELLPYLLIDEYLVKSPQDRIVLVLAIPVSGNIEMSRDGDGEIFHVLRMPDLIQYFALSNL